MVRVLTAVGKGALSTLELLDEYFINYQTSYKRAHQRLYGGGWRRSLTRPRLQYDSGERQAFYALLTRLKDQGLVEKSAGQKGTLWKITTVGFSRLALLKEKKTFYDTENDGRLKIIAYDIPEKEKFKRDWLREALRMVGFRMLQKSLWVGKTKIPEEFLDDLRKKTILQYIHILEVSKTGTLREIA